MREAVPCALTIAGSDSGGGAGIEADLKTFSSLGVFGTCAITAITAQNTTGVYEIFPIPAEVVKRQIDVVLEDIPVQATKTGMLYSKDIMVVVADSIDKYGLQVVVDPVFRAGTGDPLILEEDKRALIELVIPRALVVTPNVFEATDMARMKVVDVDGAKEAAKRVADLGAKAVVVKGGHLEGETIVDVLYCEGKFEIFKKPRVKGLFHGSGCAFSAAIAAHLALGHDVIEAVTKAEQFMDNALSFAFSVGRGRIPVNPMACLYNEAEKYHVLDDVTTAASLIERSQELAPYAAEVGMQVAMALPYALNKWHVAAVQGRIVRFDGGLKAVGCVRFGASEHLTRVILSAMKYDSMFRAALNLRYDQQLVEAFRKLGYVVSSFDRRLEPPEVKAVEGMTLSWGVQQAIKAAGNVPDVVYDLGDIGKEPMIRVLGTSARNVVEKALSAVRSLKRSCER